MDARLEEVVRGDSPTFQIALKNAATKKPLDVSGSPVVKLRVRRAGKAGGVVEVVCTKLPGLKATNGSVNVDGEYATPGKGGLVEVKCPANTFPASGEYEAEVQVTYGDGTKLTDFRLINITVRNPL